MHSVVKRIEVLGLHGRSNITLNLFPDVNILHGKNGTGKTTILHILANILDRSIDRFAFLRFDEIRVAFEDGSSVELTQLRGRRSSRDRSIQVRYQQREVANFEAETVELYELAAYRPIPYPSTFRALRSSLPRPEVTDRYQKILEAAKNLPDVGASYFPAFRTMIDAWRSVGENGSELVLTDFSMPATSPYEQEQSKLTRLARDLFGSFVPPINYPSVIEIDESLSHRVRTAEYEIAAGSEEIFSDAFVGAFEALSQSEEGARDGQREGTATTESILEQIEQLLKDLRETQLPEFTETRQADVFQRLLQILPQVQTNNQSETAPNILTVYRNAVERQVRLQKAELDPIRTYIDSVNHFLEGKRINLRAISSDPYELHARVEFDDGLTESLRALSSGERQVVGMLYAASPSNMQKSNVVLIDEPELSLHIDWQRVLVRRMLDQLGGRQLIVCTHSPEIGADYEDRYQEVAPVPYRNEWNAACEA